jgi:hypothetical protein
MTPRKGIMPSHFPSYGHDLSHESSIDVFALSDMGFFMSHETGLGRRR